MLLLPNFHKELVEKGSNHPPPPQFLPEVDACGYHRGVVAGGRTQDLGTYPCVLFDGEYAHIQPLLSLCFMSA